MKGVLRRPAQRVLDGNLLPPGEDSVVHEEPLEIRVAGESLAVTMRTPGADRELAVGFLLAEGVISSRDDLGSVVHCGRPGEEGYGNVIDVAAAPGADLDVDRIAASKRGTLTTSACGVCGRKTIEDVLARCTAVPGGGPISLASIRAAVQGLRDLQPRFALTGGLHAAAALDGKGTVLAANEDVGRHNAVDKVVGALVLAGRIPGSDAALLVVSGRAGFEIVQKASAAKIPVVASVSAPSSLAVDLAVASGITLCGFVRGTAMTVYAHPERIASYGL